MEVTLSNEVSIHIHILLGINFKYIYLVMHFFVMY